MAGRGVPRPAFDAHLVAESSAALNFPVLIRSSDFRLCRV